MDKSDNNDALKILLDFSWQKYNKQNQYFESLDSKSATMASFIGLLFSIITGLIYYLLSQTNIFSLQDHFAISLIFIIISSLLILSVTISFYLALSSLGIRKVNDPAKISDARMFFQKNEFSNNRFDRKFIIYLIKSLEKSENSFRDVNLDKSYKIKLITRWMKAATIMIIINLIYVLVFVLKC